jgi:hypothetical protein
MVETAVRSLRRFQQEQSDSGGTFVHIADCAALAQAAKGTGSAR